MLDERIEHEYCELLHKVSKRHGAKAYLNFEPNFVTDDGVFLVAVTLHLGRRLTILDNILFSTSVATMGVAIGLDQWVLSLLGWAGYALHLWVEKKKVTLVADKHVIFTEFYREWDRRHPDIPRL